MMSGIQNEFIDAKVLSIKDDNTLDVNIISKNENININMNNVTSLTPGMWTDGGCSNGEVFVDDDPTDPDIADPKTAQQNAKLVTYLIHEARWYMH